MQYQPPSSLKGDINVTPLVDVTLVLLIIFLLSAPTLHPVLVSSQGANQPSRAVAQPPPMRIRILSSTHIVLQGQQLQLDQLRAALSQKLAKLPLAQRDLLLEIDETLPVGEALKVMAVAQDSGAANILLSGFANKLAQAAKQDKNR
ncbi:MAG: biopolymer transporter ExbD [Myxococcota bacterium]